MAYEIISIDARALDRTGSVYGQLTAVAPVSRVGNNICWLCICSCGTEHVVCGGDLTSRQVKSCGCLLGAPNAARNTTHGFSRHPLYPRWRNMIDRCYNPRCASYKFHGARGIVVCKRWRTSVRAFIDDMGHPPTEFHQLDRIDNNGHYEPANVRWATPQQQANNRRSNRLFTHNGETKTLSQWARHIGVNVTTLKQRITYGWTFEEAIQGHRHTV